MTGGFQDTELADDLVGVTSARLLAAGVPRLERMRAMRLLGVLVTMADARRRVRRPLAELAVEFDLPVDEVDQWLEHLIEVGAVRWEDGKLVLAALEPPAPGGLRLNDFLALAAEPIQARPRRTSAVRPVGAALAAVAVVALALLAPGVVRDRATPASTTRDEAPATTVPVGRPTTTGRSSGVVSDEAPSTTVPRVEQVGPAVVPTTTSLVLPCPAGTPLITVLGTTTDADGRLAVDGQARNRTDQPMVIHGVTLHTTVGGRDVAVPGLVQDLVVPARSSVLWQATVPVTAPAGTLVQAALGEWSWSNPSLPSTCATPSS